MVAHLKEFFKQFLILNCGHSAMKAIHTFMIGDKIIRIRVYSSCGNFLMAYNRQAIHIYFVSLERFLNFFFVFAHSKHQFKLFLSQEVIFFVQIRMGNIWLILQYIYLLMSKIDYIPEEFDASDPYWNYYFQPNLKQEKEPFPFITQASSQINQQLKCPPMMNDQSLFENYPSSNAEIPEQSKKRGKKIIQVNQKGREKYLKAKTGQKSNSNDLSVHAMSLIKTSFTQYETFFCLSQDGVQFLDEFKNNKHNLSSLRKLLEDASQQKSSDAVSEKGEKGSSAGSETYGMGLPFINFLVQRFENSKVISQIMCNRKMSFGKKKMLIRFIGAIRKSFDCPKSLKSWKKLLP